MLLNTIANFEGSTECSRTQENRNI